MISEETAEFIESLLEDFGPKGFFYRLCPDQSMRGFWGTHLSKEDTDMQALKPQSPRHGHMRTEKVRALSSGARAPEIVRIIWKCQSRYFVRASDAADSEP